MSSPIGGGAATVVREQPMNVDSLDHLVLTVRSIARESGAVEFLTKPFRDQDLLDAIQQALQRDRDAHQQQVAMHDLEER